MLYLPTVPKVWVVPVSHILGRLALVPAGDSGTIPETMRGREPVMYPGGRCDSAGEPGSGSRLFFINSWAMIWPSDYPKIQD